MTRGHEDGARPDAQASRPASAAREALRSDTSPSGGAESWLSESFERLQLALSVGNLGDWSWDLDTGLVTMSPRAAAILGVATGNSTPRESILSRVHPDDLEAMLARVDASTRDGTDFQVEYRLRDAAGRETWVAASGRTIYGPDRTPRGRIGIVQDVTERKHFELVQQRLAAIVESTDDAIVSKDLDGIVQTWNQGAQRIFGHTEDEMIGQPIRRLIPPELYADEDRILALLREGEHVDHYETVRLTKDGARIDVSISVSPLRDSLGRVIGACKVARDITARKRAADALRDESRVLDLLNETGKSIAADLDLRTLVQRVTDSATQLSGAEFGAYFFNTSADYGDAFELYTLSGATREAFDQLGFPRATPIFEPTFVGAGPVRIDDVLADPRYGQWAPHFGMPRGHLPVRSYLAVSVNSRSGEVLGGLFFGHSSPGVFTERIERIVVGIAAQAAVAIDNARLYERVRAAADDRQQLLDAERHARSEAERVSLMKDEFLANLSHELRTPLNAIVGWASLLGMKQQVDPDVTEGLTVIERNARVQAKLIEDLLDMSRIISGKIRLDVQRVELQELVRAAIAAVQHSADAKGIRLQCVLDSRAGPVWGDSNRLQQCFWNLLSNAIKFTHKSGKIQVGLTCVNSHIEFHVSDEGQGIDPEFLPHLFARFRQADASSTRQHGGLGLGLSIVKKLVELHGGRVHAASAGLGHGSTFTIELPMMACSTLLDTPDRAHPRAEPSRSAAHEMPNLEGICVLTVDDELDARMLVKRVLEECGARVLVASSARKGLEIVRAERPDVVISDIGMPGEDGYTMMRELRRLPPEHGGRTPAAALSAFARPEDRTRALRAGYHMHLSKPVDPSELAAVVASLAARG